MLLFPTGAGGRVFGRGGNRYHLSPHFYNELIPHRAHLRDAPVTQLELEPMLRAKAKEQQGARNDFPQKSAESKQPIETRKELAKIAGVSHDTVSKAKSVLESGNEELIEEVTRNQRAKLAL